MTTHPKVFCIGFHKTGTTSLYSALTTLGLHVTGSVGYDWSADKLASDGAQLCIDTMKTYDAAEDMPWPHFYRELDAAYPGAKFILTSRDPQAWFRSIDNHFGHQATELNAFAYGRDHARARDDKDHWIRTYNTHNENVREYFRDRPDDLLEMTLTKGDGWDKLSRFLGCEIPAKPFPIKNTRERRHSLAYRVKRKLCLLTGRTPHPERLI
jgi:Sulfotransferase domain